MKTSDKKLRSLRIATIIFLLFSCFYMYDFYKSLSGFIANGFREPLVMLPMITAFFLPVFCFLFFVWEFFVKSLSVKAKVAYSAFVIAYAIADLALIFSNISLYASNNSLGVYDSLPSIIIHFPYDMIVLLAFIIVWQVFNVYLLFKKNAKASELLSSLKKECSLKLSGIEYIILSVFAIVIFVFAGAAVYGIFTALENALYDLRYIYLLLWLILIPLGNLLMVTLKPEKMAISKKRKTMILSVAIFANLIFGALFLIFELTNPDFLIHIGKPLFLITFSISLPIEPVIIFAIMALTVLVLAMRLIRMVRDKKQN